MAQESTTTDWSEVMSASYEVKGHDEDEPAAESAVEGAVAGPADHEGAAATAARDTASGAEDAVDTDDDTVATETDLAEAEAAEGRRPGARSGDAGTPAAPCERRSCRLALRGMRAHVALSVLAVLAAAASGAYDALPYLTLGFETPLATAAYYAASYAPLLPALAVALGLPAVALAVAAGGTTPAATRAGTLVAWVVDTVVAAACLGALGLSAMGSGVSTVVGLGLATVAMGYLAVNDELAARAALVEMRRG